MRNLNYFIRVILLICTVLLVFKLEIFFMLFTYIQSQVKFFSKLHFVLHCTCSAHGLHLVWLHQGFQINGLTLVTLFNTMMTWWLSQCLKSGNRKKIRIYHPKWAHESNYHIAKRRHYLDSVSKTSRVQCCKYRYCDRV